MLPNPQGKDIPIINLNPNLPWININPGPYDYKLFFEGNYYPHSVNLTKLTLIIKHQNQLFKKVIFLSTGHSFADSMYMSNFGCVIKKTTNISDLVFAPDNLFYSIDDGFNDFALISFGAYNINQDNYLDFLDKRLVVNSIYRYQNIKNLELDMIIKKGHNTGESFAKAVIDFAYDPAIHTVHNKQNFYTFKLNGKIVIVNTPYASGLILKGRESTITKYNGNPLDPESQNTHLEYHFINTIKTFKSHELFNGFHIDNSIKAFYKKYTANDKLTILSLMGDSGSGFYKLGSDNTIKLLGINIGSCYMVVLGTHQKPNLNTNVYYDEELNKLVVGQYYIEEVHKASQVLPIGTIEQFIKSIPGSVVEAIEV